MADSLCSFSYSILNTAPAESIALAMCSSVACISARDLTLRLSDVIEQRFRRSTASQARRCKYFDKDGNPTYKRRRRDIKRHGRFLAIY